MNAASSMSGRPARAVAGHCGGRPASTNACGRCPEARRTGPRRAGFSRFWRSMTARSAAIFSVPPQRLASCRVRRARCGGNAGTSRPAHRRARGVNMAECRSRRHDAGHPGVATAALSKDHRGTSRASMARRLGKVASFSDLQRACKSPGRNCFRRRSEPTKPRPTRRRRSRQSRHISLKNLLVFRGLEAAMALSVNRRSANGRLFNPDGLYARTVVA